MILYIFIDGIGFGKNTPDTNPFAKFPTEFFSPLAEITIPNSSKFHEMIYVKTDASMGVEGLPQSATGQTAIWTGINAPSAIQRHVSGYPTFTLKKIISKYSILKILTEHKIKCGFLNCYSPLYFEQIKKNPRQVSASTLIQMAAGIPFKTIEDLRNGKGLYMDITHEFLRVIGKNYLDPTDDLLIPRDPFQMGERLYENSKDYDLAVFEYFLTDKVGHDRNWENAERVISTLELFFQGILTHFNPDKDQLIVTSDHGNLEDLSTNKHTSNLVPTILFGKYSDSMSKKIKSLYDIVPEIYSVFDLNIFLNQKEFLNHS
ncbi:MAG: metalloenzyme [Leptospiraceae bacterium]|nr:metalloenzyme [Leptospiraceae bacterium]MCK6382435.1 metalloenzyme [Leptospiraceae bacterium]NUM40842.1 metalloenzyme [Leptospiraceae bacterium]